MNDFDDIQSDELDSRDYYDAADYDGQPTEYEEWQDYMGGDDWDHGQYDGMDYDFGYDG